MNALVSQPLSPDPLYVELHADLIDFLIDRDCGGWEGLTDQDRAEVTARASAVAHGLIRLSLKALGKDLQEAVADGSIYHALVSPLPMDFDLKIDVYVRGVKA